MLEDVKAFIDENIFYSDIWDALDEKKQSKAVNNASLTLYNHYGRYNEDTNPLPVQAIAFQALWIVQIDDSIRRAEQGVTYITVSGMAVNLATKDRSIAPEVIKLLGRGGRIGRYQTNISDTFRHRTDPRFAQRGYN